MMLRNRVSRYHVAEAAIRGASVRNERVRMELHELVSGIRHQIEKVKEEIWRTGRDPEGVYDRPDFGGMGGGGKRDVGYAD